MNLFLEAGTIFWILGGLVTIFGAAFRWLGIRLDKKLSKDVFAQFEKRNDDQHKLTHKALERIDMKLDKKQDKNP